MDRSPAFGICHLSVVPLRSEANDRAAQVSQLLFGETFEILEQQEKWTRVRTTWDEYEGWIDHKQYIVLTDGIEAYAPAFPAVATDLVNPVLTATGETIPLLLGSTLPRYNGDQVYINEQEYTFLGKSAVSASAAVQGRLEEYAFHFLNAPYLWGGRSLFGIDCSGFVQVVYKILGYRLRRDAWQQAEQGTLVNFLEEAQPGDLAFFDNEEERIIHVGIVLNDHKIIHASGKVRVDVLDHQGIFNVDTKRYSHKLRIIKRIL